MEEAYRRMRVFAKRCRKRPVALNACLGVAGEPG